MPDGLTPDQAAFWAAFRASHAAPPDAEDRFHSVFAIGAGSDEAAEAVRDRTKDRHFLTPDRIRRQHRARRRQPLALDQSAGPPRRHRRTFWTSPLSLDQMDADFIRDYGKWDGPAAFRTGMLKWYQGIHQDFTSATPLLSERFRVIWPRP